MEAILGSEWAKRMFYSLMLFLLIVLLFIRYYIIPSWMVANSMSQQITNSIVDNLFASLIATVIIGAFIFWITPREARKKIELIEGTSIAERKFTLARESTDIWYYSGGTGRYTRSTTLPALASNARKDGVHKLIYIQIMNPNNLELCRKYSVYRNSLKSAKNTKWTPEKVRCELFATIVSSFIWRANSPLLEISVYLKNYFSLFRIDLSSQFAFITKEDPDEPILFVENGSYLYNSFKEEFNQTLKQSSQIRNSLTTIDSMDDINLDNVKALLNDLEIAGDLTDRAIEDIIKTILKNENPFNIDWLRTV